MKSFHLLVTAGVVASAILPWASASQAHHGPHPVFNITPYGSAPVTGIVGSGATPNNQSGVIFGNGKQQSVNAAGTNLSVASISGRQTVKGKTITVSTGAAQAVIAVIDSRAGSDIPAVGDLTSALGGGSAAQQLAQSLQGLRGSDGSISPIILSKAVSTYNDYLKSLVKSDKDSQKPTTDLASFVENLPAGQKAVQVILGKLVAAVS